MSKAKSFFFVLQKEPSKIEEDLTKIFKNKNLEIKRVKLLKDKLIINEQHKIVALLSLKNNLQEKVILEIHDNSDYFQRNIFALKELGEFKSDIGPAKLFGEIQKSKIIVREHLRGDFFSDLIFKKALNLNRIFSLAKEMGSYLAFLHKLKFSSKFLSKKLNKKIEKIILKRTIEFIKPNIKILAPQIEKNLKNLLKKMEELDERNRICLIHGDYQAASFILCPKKVFLMDFDTLEVGNPARDLGRFLFQISHLMELAGYPRVGVKKTEEIFLKNYFKHRKLNLYPNFEQNINLHKAEMIQYFILGKIWGKKIANKKEIKNLLDCQTKLLNL